MLKYIMVYISLTVDLLSMLVDQLLLLYFYSWNKKLCNIPGLRRIK